MTSRLHLPRQYKLITRRTFAACTPTHPTAMPMSLRLREAGNATTPAMRMMTASIPVQPASIETPEAGSFALQNAPVAQYIRIEYGHQLSTEPCGKISPGMNHGYLDRIQHLNAKQHCKHDQEQSDEAPHGCFLVRDL